MKTYYNITSKDVELYYKKTSLFRNFVSEFYDSIKNKPNVLSKEEVFIHRNSFSFFSKSIWSSKKFLSVNMGVRGLLERPPVIFGLESGICFFEGAIYFIYGKGDSDYYICYIGDDFDNVLEISGNIISIDKSKYIQNVSARDIIILVDLLNLFKERISKFNLEIENETILEHEELLETKISAFKQLDKDNNGEVDLIENDFNKLLTKNQKKVLEIDKNYIHQFVKVSNYIKTKKTNIQKIFETIESSSTKSQLDERLNLLQNQIHTYELLVFHSINMIGALVKEDLITFYEIYESFDKIGIYNSNWENEVSNQLFNIGNKLDELMYSINQMEINIVNEISNLTYVTQESFKDLSKSVSEQLKEVESTIETNNLLTLINTYQVYKINKNTKSLKG